VTFWLMDHFAFVRSFRETDKTVALLAFAYAYLGAPAVDELAAAPRRRGVAVGVAALAIAVPAVYGLREFAGDWGALRPVSFPASWSEADAILRERAANARTLFLPFHGYLHLGFAHARVTYNPAPQFFSTPILASRRVDSDPAHQDVLDPEQTRIEQLLADPSRPDLARCLAALGIAHVLLAHEADWRTQRFLDHTPGFVVTRTWPDLTLISLRRPGALAMTAPATSGGPCPVGLSPLSSHLISPVRLRLLAPVVPGRRLVLGLPDADQWKRTGNDVVFRAWPRYRTVYIVAAAGWLVVLSGGIAVFLLGRRRRPYQR
jgi:hypothetical protein